MSDTPRIPRPPDEAERLAELRRYALQETPGDGDFDFLAELAARLCGTPYAFVTLVDEHRVWSKAAFGMEARSHARDDDYCSWTILEAGGMRIPDLQADARTAGMALTADPRGYRMYCGANLVSSNGHHIGSLCVLGTAPRQVDDATAAILDKLARQVMILIELRARTRALETAYDRLHELATVDELTGLLNRRALMEQLQVEIERGRRLALPFALVLLDLDNFKRLNDTSGHLMGDAVLRGVGALLRERLRVTDTAGRYGGEELCLLLPGTETEAAVALANLLRQNIAATVYESMGAQAHVSASFGVAVWRHDAATSTDQLIEQADRALYRAKHLGRNRVEHHS
jgi:diguanylate cyclase (GGDEF)-like protein